MTALTDTLLRDAAYVGSLAPATMLLRPAYRWALDTETGRPVRLGLADPEPAGDAAQDS